ncbi:hypothetical protein AB1Y20_018111 [Prymnesium parvum]|uniref:Uncharacterized protein n=1 Tax=Prymnesium parvum TaxID=97485 RepID=A0AB34JR75_PRYPA
MQTALLLLAGTGITIASAYQLSAARLRATPLGRSHVISSAGWLAPLLSFMAAPEWWSSCTGILCQLCV